MRGVNKVIIVGSMGTDPEVRYTTSGNAVANLNIATSESWTDKSTGQKQERTEWHRVTLYQRLAEIAGEYLKKGSKVYIEGSLRTRKWQDKNSGQDRYTTEIIGNEMQMLGDSGSREGGRPQQSHPSRGTDVVEGTVDAFDDDVPFMRPISPDGLCMPGDTGAWFGPCFSPWTLGKRSIAAVAA